MTAKEKAQELVDKFYQKQCEILNKNGMTPFEECEYEIATASAIIAVEEVLNTYINAGIFNKIVDYWNEVKTEINAL